MSQAKQPHRWLIIAGLALWSLFIISGCGSAVAPASIPCTATPGFAVADNPTTGAIARSTRQVQATKTRQSMLDEEATEVAIQTTQTAEARAAAAATLVARATAQAIVATQADWPVLIDESFADNQLGWPLGLEQDLSLAVTEGGYDPEALAGCVEGCLHALAGLEAPRDPLGPPPYQETEIERLLASARSLHGL